MKNLLSIDLFGPQKDMARDQVTEIIVEALRMVPYYVKAQQPEPHPNMIQPNRRRIMVSIFEEMSTRTRHSTEAAARLIGFDIDSPITPEGSSLGKHESYMNTLRMLSQQLVTTAVIRSKVEGIGLHLALCLERTATPESWVRRDMSLVIGGAGVRDHPSQVLLDVTTIVLRSLGVRRMEDCRIIEDIFTKTGAVESLKEKIAEILDGLKIAFVGDLIHSRVVHDWIHLAQWFSIEFTFVAPPIFQLEGWCLANIKNPSFSENLEAATEAHYVYMIRMQMERLTESMPEHKAHEIALGLQVDEEFINCCQGEIMHALPEDNRFPMIDPDLWNHPKCIMFMQSAVGIPTRMAILRLCDNGRMEKFPLLEVPPIIVTPQNVLRSERLEDHWRRMQEKYQNQPMFMTQVRNGAVIDRLPPGMSSVVDKINQRFGLYDGSSSPILRGKRLSSKIIPEGKEVIYLHDCWPTAELAAFYGIVAPPVRISTMKESEELAGRDGYLRIEYPLPRAVSDIFHCLNSNCITRCGNDPEAHSFFWVIGTKGKPVGLKCAYCQNHFSAADLVAAEFGRPRQHQ